MTRPFALALALVFLAAGCNGNGAREAGPVPKSPASGASSTAKKTSATTTKAAATTSASETTSATALCSSRTAAVTMGSQEGAAGTIRTVWRVKNTASHSCHTRGYPGMDFHASSGWLGVQVHRGGYPDIDGPPASVVLSPGQSLHYVSYWGDVGNSGPCTEFDRVKVTLPDNTVSAKVGASGCLNPQTVHVGPVTK